MDVVLTKRLHGSRFRCSAVLNSSLKRYIPWLHRLLKGGAYRIGLPLPKILWGRAVWTHSRLWNHAKWDESVLQWVNEYLKPGDVFFDVGSSSGLAVDGCGEADGDAAVEWWLLSRRLSWSSIYVFTNG